MSVSPFNSCKNFIQILSFVSLLKKVKEISLQGGLLSNL
ncbi:MAG: hypothetical protein MAGBODY4_01429 [Candidatus Marinimicrobia bacterium]|nr:hypothetical protein [Candidatus Neomarinimicrobiota bacterium]